ncbi:FAD-dependent oxidoreductase [Actinocrinis puniceicyclus]|uniref:FAD-dependent oxidoreductase n=1 Tax=Actinocrinis puniceicyclus TaxID=977794 RepID=A0A8J7WQB9_9ACTN|nr:FAD-dependent oxidoreductase [Actinocrinis puniceicyclus]MBS2963585.1 FAD-dependent oxidoreductase [Actinocrinis puniceicyclus]
MHADVCVVGGGIAGLAAAVRLAGEGLSVTVLEAAQDAGGRAKDARVDGFTLGDGAHLLHTTWPALRHAVPPAQLALGGFAAGVRVCSGGGSAPVSRVRFGAAPKRPQQTFSALRMPIGTPADKARLSKLLYRLATTPPQRALSGPEQAAAESFASRGYSPELVDRFLRPYLAGLAADDDLSASARGADWLLRLLVRGRFAVAGAGIGALVRRLAGRLPEGALRTGARVHTVRADRVVSEAGEIRARAIVVASDPHAATALLPGLHEPRMRSVTTLWHTVDDSALPFEPDRSPYVLVDAEPGSPVGRTAVVSRAAPALAPVGRALVATTVFGDDGKEPGALDRAVLPRLAELHGVPARCWETLEIRHVEQALVTMQSPYNFTRPVRLIKGLYVCGDHRDLPNVEGALQSGQRAANAVLEDLAGRP